jgi:hypothetical protein
VETAQADAFLAGINWHNLTSGKSSDWTPSTLRDRIFKIEFLKD